MSDLVNRLRTHKGTAHENESEAADEIERLRAGLYEQTNQTLITATQIRDHVCDVLRRYGVLPDSLGHPIEQIIGRVVCDLQAEIERLRSALQRLYDYHDAPAKCTAEYMDAVTEAGDILKEVSDG